MQATMNIRNTLIKGLMRTQAPWERLLVPPAFTLLCALMPMCMHMFPKGPAQQ